MIVLLFMRRQGGAVQPCYCTTSLLYNLGGSGTWVDLGPLSGEELELVLEPLKVNGSLCRLYGALRYLRYRELDAFFAGSGSVLHTRVSIVYMKTKNRHHLSVNYEGFHLH